MGSEFGVNLRDERCLGFRGLGLGLGVLVLMQNCERIRYWGGSIGRGLGFKGPYGCEGPGGTNQTALSWSSTHYYTPKCCLNFGYSDPDKNPQKEDFFVGFCGLGYPDFSDQALHPES